MSAVADELNVRIVAMTLKQRRRFARCRARARCDLRKMAKIQVGSHEVCAYLGRHNLRQESLR